MLRSHIKWKINEQKQINNKTHVQQIQVITLLDMLVIKLGIPKIFHHIPDSAPDSYSWHLPWALRVSGYAATRPPARRCYEWKFHIATPLIEDLWWVYGGIVTKKWLKHGSSRGFMMVYVIWKSIKHVPKHQPAICSNREYVLGPTGRKSSTFRHPQISLFFKSPSLTIISLLCHLCW